MSAEPTKAKKILFHSHDGIGHINACLGLAEPLRDRGHQIIFVSTSKAKSHIENRGFLCEYLDVDPNESFKNVQKSSNKSLLPNVLPQSKAQVSNTKVITHGGPTLKSGGILSGLEPIEKMKLMLLSPFPLRLFHLMKPYECRLEKIVAEHQPHLIVIDHFVPSPVLTHCGRPWIYLHSSSALYAYEHLDTPPAFSGFPTKNKDQSKWNEFRGLLAKWHEETGTLLNQWLEEKNLKPNIDQSKRTRVGVIESPYLNIYQYPLELDYFDVRPLPPKWLSVDTFGIGRTELESMSKLPAQFSESKDDSKLIYLSLGTLGCFDTDLLNRLVNILSNCPHRVIVSKGPLGSQIELPSNMFGANYVSQSEVLAVVDLVITHGGNNTFTETFAAGKPMIVMPLFADQYDNGTRVEETGFGVQLNPYQCTEMDLLSAVNRLLTDRGLHERLQAASKRINTGDRLKQACDRVEKLFE